MKIRINSNLQLRVRLEALLNLNIMRIVNTLRTMTVVLLVFSPLVIGAPIQEDDSVLQVPMAELDQYWDVKNVARPKYPTSAVMSGEDGCAAVAFIIEPDGTTSTHQALVSFPSTAFAKPSVQALRKWKFSPTESNTSNQAVYTFQTIAYQIDRGHHSNSEDEVSLDEACTEAANKLFKKDTSDAGAS